jgi:adhesin transport system outer membrane protein
MRSYLVNVSRIYLGFFLFFFSFSAHSLNLTELIEGLLNTDTSIKNAESAVTEARNDIKTAWAAYLPEFDVKFIRGSERKYKYEADNQFYDHQEMDITLKQKMWDFGETGSDIRQKRNAFITADLDLQAEKMTLTLDAVDAYLGYIDAAKKYDSEIESLISKIESTGQEESRVKKGSGLASDVLQAKGDLATSQKDKIKAEGDLRKARNKYFKVFKTEPPDDIDSMNLIELSSLGKSQLPTSLDDALSKAILGNVDYVKTEIDIEDAEQDVVSARSEFLPDLDFEATYKWKYNVSNTSGGEEEVNWKVTLAVPLQPWQDSADYRNKKLAYLTAQRDYEEESYVTKQTVGDLWEDYQVAQVTRDFAINKIVISEELLTIKKRERQLDQADAAAVTAAENAVNDDTQTLIDDETALTESALDLLESIGALTLASLQDQSSTSVESSEAASTEATTEEVTTEAATETASEDEGPPPEAAPVEGVVITNYTDEEQMNLAAEAEQARLALANAISGSGDAGTSESDAAASTGCASNTYIGQQQADGSWKTVCKE